MHGRAAITEAHMTTDERFDALEKTVRRQRITITALVLVAVEAVVILPVNKLWPQSRILPPLR